MGTTNMLASEQIAVVGTIDPDALAAGTHDSDWVNMEDFESILAVVMAGELGASATVDAKLRQATDGSGTSAKDITGKAITQLTQAGTDDDKQALINCRRDELDVDNNFTHVSLRITVAVATSDGGGAILGVNPRYGPANDADLASVDEIVS